MDTKRPPTSDEAITTIRQVVERAASDRLFLMIMQDGHFITQPLPEAGDVIIGRSERCDVRIQDPSISRQHSVLRIGGKLLTVEDLGSANGTVVRETKLEPNTPTEISTNEVFVLGTVSVVVQQRATPVKSRRVWSHDYFEGRVAEECARAERTATAFTVLRLRFEGHVAPEQVQEPFSDVLREVDVIGLYRPGEYEILLIDTTADEADVVIGRLSAQFDKHGIPLGIGRASYPVDGRDADKLIGRANKSARSATAPSPGERSVVLEDGAMRNLYRLAERVAQGNINVLILGETGVGKQVLAEFIHAHSPRRDKPFLELNCSAFSETLLESELFGHEKGAFTGAMQSKPGLLETASGGTVFLDEIGDMALALQAKVLRVIENGEVLRVGGLKPRSIDVRFVAATNRELEAEVMRGSFRQDLFFRINGVTLQIPPLRQRAAEIEHLADAFIAEFCEHDGRRGKLRLSEEAVSLLTAYTWPGNIRELRNVIERATLLSNGNLITAEHLPVEKMSATFAMPVKVPTGRGWPLPSSAEIESNPPVGAVANDAASAMLRARARKLGRESDEDKRRRIVEALMQCGGNNTEAAKLLGISRRTLGKWLELYDIPRPRKKKGP